MTILAGTKAETASSNASFSGQKRKAEESPEQKQEILPLDSTSSPLHACSLAKLKQSISLDLVHSLVAKRQNRDIHQDTLATFSHSLNYLALCIFGHELGLDSSRTVDLDMLVGDRSRLEKLDKDDCYEIISVLYNRVKELECHMIYSALTEYNASRLPSMSSTPDSKGASQNEVLSDQESLLTDTTASEPET